MKLSNGAGDIIVTHALGSCVGIAIHDPVAHVGGILHYMLPVSSIDKERASNNPFMFGDLGIPELFRQAYVMGATKQNLRIVMAGGAQIIEKQDIFAIGKRNVMVARKMFWKNNIIIAAEHVGSNLPRTLYLEVGSGKTWLTAGGSRVEL
jgi:chemotaxis protein CheD